MPSIGILVTLLSACAGNPQARAIVVHPATIPAMAFPRVLVLGSDSEESQWLISRISAHLESDTRVVEPISASQLQALTDAGSAPTATLVLAVSVRLRESQEGQLVRRSQWVCDPSGCYRDRRPILGQITVLSGDVELRAIEPSTGEVLQREHLHESERGEDPLGMRLRVLERLSDETSRLLSLARREEVRVDLLPVDAPPVVRALAAMSGGDWALGSRLLRTFTASLAFGELSPRARSRVWYNLSLAFRFDVSEPSASRFSAAADALQRALRAAPDARYARAIEALTLHRQAQAQVEHQRRARQHNFGLLEASPNALRSDAGSAR